MGAWPRAVVLLGLAALAAGSEVAGSGADPIEADRVVVKLSAAAAARAGGLPVDSLPAGPAELAAFRARHGVADGHRVMRNPHPRDPELFHRLGLDRIYVLRLPRSDAQLARRLVRELSRQSWVEYAEPVVRMLDLTVPNDPQFGNQWAHQNTGQVVAGTPGKLDADIDSTEAWDIGTGDPANIIAILDDGLDLDHEDLVDNWIAGYDFLQNDPDPGTPAGGHGTRVAGVAGARGDNAIGVAGVCWSCALMPLRRGSDHVSIANGTQYAADHGADVINMSFAAWGTWPRVTKDAIEYARGLGTLSVAGAGNDGTYFPVTPAALGNVLAVGATTNRDERVSFSNTGEHLSVVAPGQGIYTTSNAPGPPFNEVYEPVDGTSLATPFVSGLAGLLRAHDRDLHVNELWHLITLGAQDQVGLPTEDTPGFDPFMGQGRINAAASLALIDGPWLALDRPHYICAGNVTVALKDRSASSPVEVTLAADVGGDTETVILAALTAGGYYEGSLPISWAGKDGPVVPNNGTLELADGETLTATRGGLSATAAIGCVKEVCPLAYRPVIDGDCDRDGALDPGELWRVSVPLSNRQAELLSGAEVRIETTHPDIAVLQDLATYDEVPPWYRGGTLPDEDGSEDPFILRTESGTPANGSATFLLTVTGKGWEPDVSACAVKGFGPTFSLPLNRQAGPQILLWDFDDGTNKGFTHSQAHVTGQLSTCTAPFFNDFWLTNPVTDRAHTGAYSMRCGDGIIYGTNHDGALRTPLFTVPPTGGALGFYAYMQSGMTDDRLAPDGMLIEVLPTGQSTWTPVHAATYNADQHSQGCNLQGDAKFPFGTNEVVDLLSGDGPGDLVDGDTFDREHLADLSNWAGQQVRVRFRFGADDFHDPVAGKGVWIDTVSVHGAWVADSWAGSPPPNLAASDAACPAALKLDWDPVPGALSYRVYRSTISCADAETTSTVYGATLQSAFTDAAVTEGVTYHYAVEAVEPSTGCSGQRACAAATCACAGPPAGPTELLVDRAGADVVLSWDDPGAAGLTWNVYRDVGPDPAGWGGPYAMGVVDDDPGLAGIQHVDAGAAAASESFYYLITTVSPCGESPLAR